MEHEIFLHLISIYFGWVIFNWIIDCFDSLVFYKLLWAWGRECRKVLQMNSLLEKQHKHHYSTWSMNWLKMSITCSVRLLKMFLVSVRQNMQTRKHVDVVVHDDAGLLLTWFKMDEFNVQNVPNVCSRFTEYNRRTGLLCLLSISWSMTNVRWVMNTFDNIW